MPVNEFREPRRAARHDPDELRNGNQRHRKTESEPYTPFFYFEKKQKGAHYKQHREAVNVRKDKSSGEQADDNGRKKDGEKGRNLCILRILSIPVNFLFVFA